MKFDKIQFNTEIWQEGKMYVSYVPQLDLSSCGKTVEEAKANIKEAVELFFAEAKKMGSLRQILEESGYFFDKVWRSPELVAFEKMQLAF